MKRRTALKVGELVKVAALSWEERMVQTVSFSRMHLISPRAHYIFNPEFTFRLEGIDWLFISLGEGLSWKRGDCQLSMTFRDHNSIPAINGPEEGEKS